MRRAIQSTSPDAFMLHPLSITHTLHPDSVLVQWACKKKIQDANTFKFVVRPGVDHCLVSCPPVRRWMQRRRLIPFSYNRAILNIKDKEVYHVDVVAEREGRLCLVLIYYTSLSCPFYSAAMLQHAQNVKTACREQYALDAEIALLRLTPSGTSVRGWLL